MKYLGYVISALFIISCVNTNEEKIKAIEGYWNIDEVILPDGSQREFPFSNHMDHFEIDGFQGVKNRVSPRYDGSFVSYGNPVYFKWEEKDGLLVLLFNKEEGSYQQTVEKATNKELVLRHENGTKYFYKIHTPDEK